MCDGSLFVDIEELSKDCRPASVKSAEEIARHSIDESLDDVQRAVHILSRGDDEQKLSVVRGLAKLLENHLTDCTQNRILPRLQEALRVAETELHQAACAAFIEVLSKKLVPVNTFCETFLRTILESVESQNQEIADAWLGTLLEVIAFLPPDVIQAEILSTVTKKGHLTRTVWSRLSCCRILGRSALRLDPFKVQKEILPHALSLCQDVDAEVRACMCRNIPSLARGLGNALKETTVFTELIELANDEENCVRIAGLETILDMLDLIDKETRAKVIIPLVQKFCNDVMSNDHLAAAVGLMLGPLLHALKDNVTPQQKVSFVECYKKLCTYRSTSGRVSKQGNYHQFGAEYFSQFADLPKTSNPSEECRRNAALSLPAMIQYIGAEGFSLHLSGVFSKLCRDESALVRRVVAASFHQVLRMTSGHTCFPHLLRDLEVLYHDTCLQVLQTLLQNTCSLFKFISEVVKTDTEIRDSLAAAIYGCEKIIFNNNNWRIQEYYLIQLSFLPLILPSNHIFHKFIPLLMNKLYKARPLPVRRAAVRSILILLRSNHQYEQRLDICLHIINDLGQSTNCYNRGLFIDACIYVLELYSRHFFKQLFYEALLAYAKDPVPNIRLRLCPLLPTLKAMVILPTDNGLWEKLDEASRKLFACEKDKDVRVAVYKTCEALDKVHLRQESQLNLRPVTSEDVADRAKERIEQELLCREEESVRLGETKPAKSEKKQSSMMKKSTPARRATVASRLPVPGPPRSSSCVRRSGSLKLPLRTEPDVSPAGFKRSPSLGSNPNKISISSVASPKPSQTAKPLPQISSSAPSNSTSSRIPTTKPKPKKKKVPTATRR